jgi:hypothetical protein
VLAPEAHQGGPAGAAVTTLVEPSMEAAGGSDQRRRAGCGSEPPLRRLDRALLIEIR